MKKHFFILLFFVAMQHLQAQFTTENYPAYNGKDLGLTYSKASATFKIWSPTASAAELLLYKNGDGGAAFKTIALSQGANGSWHTKLNGDLKGTYYTFRVKINEQWSNEVADPYAKEIGRAHV